MSSHFFLVAVLAVAVDACDNYYRVQSDVCADACLGSFVGICPIALVIKGGSLKDGDCASQGYTVADGSISQKAGPCGNITFAQHTKPADAEVDVESGSNSHIAPELGAPAGIPAVCSDVQPYLPKECACAAGSSHESFNISCSVHLVESTLKLNDTIGVAIEVSPCANPSSVSLDILEANHHIDFPITSVQAGDDVQIPIPGLSVAIPKIGSVGVDADVAVDGNPDHLTLKIGLNACGKIDGKAICASQIPLLNKVLPIWLVDHSFSLGSFCNSTKRAAVQVNPQADKAGVLSPTDRCLSPIKKLKCAIGAGGWNTAPCC